MGISEVGNTTALSWWDCRNFAGSGVCIENFWERDFVAISCIDAMSDPSKLLIFRILHKLTDL